MIAYLSALCGDRMQPIYLDNLATTPVDPRVLDAMLPYFRETFGNAASQTHLFGHRAVSAVEEARAHIGCLINAEARAIVFTSGATESVNLAIKGVAQTYHDRGRRIVTARTEHRAVLDVIDTLETDGFEIVRLDVDADGHLSLDAVDEAVTPDTILVSIMHANNEVGTLHDIAAIGAIARDRGAFLHCDAAQSLGKTPIDVETMKIDLLSISAHKLYGPKGVGALYCRRRDPRVRLAPQVHGGGHERGMRSGTLNVPGIVGFGAAAAIAGAEMTADSERVMDLRQHLLAALRNGLDGITVNGREDASLAGCLNVAIDRIDAMQLLERIPEIALSTGSACTTAIPQPSHVLSAMGLEPERAYASIRFGLGRFTTRAEIDSAAERILATATELRTCPPADDDAERTSCVRLST